MRTVFVAISGLAILAGTAGCGAYLPHAASQALITVKVGMTREEVVKQLGEPHSRETVGQVELLTYRPDWSVVGANTFTPIGITDGKVSGLGPIYAAKVKSAAK